MSCTHAAAPTLPWHARAFVTAAVPAFSAPVEKYLELSAEASGIQAVSVCAAMMLGLTYCRSPLPLLYTCAGARRRTLPQRLRQHHSRAAATRAAPPAATRHAQS